MTYKVTIDFKRGPSFSLDVTTPRKEDAIEQATAYARGCGFDAPVKKAVAVPV
jgi:hypothetical protein